MKLEFAKENKKWYIVWPAWKGRKSALQMVSGADTLLDHITEGKPNVILNISEEEFEYSNCLVLMEKCFWNGAYYHIGTYENKKLDLTLWLCDVTKIVLGKFPEKIYFNIGK